MVENEKVKSIFMGKVTRKSYHFYDKKNPDYDYYYGKPCISESIETEHREKIAECEVTRPPFAENETVYIPEIKKYTTVERVTRSTDGSIYYNVTYVVKELGDDNEISLKEKNETENKLKEELVKYQEYLERQKKRLQEKPTILEKTLDVAYLEPSFNICNNNSISITCFYKDKKFLFDNITPDKLDDILIKSWNLGIDKENTKLYIVASGMGIWFYDILVNKGYKAEKINEEDKRIKQK